MFILPDRNNYCPITATKKSHIYLETIYSRQRGTVINSQGRRKVICVDPSSSVEGTPTGVLLFPLLILNLS